LYKNIILLVFKKQASLKRKSTERHDIQHNDTLHNDTQHNEIQHNNTQQNDGQHVVLMVTHNITDIEHNGTQHKDEYHILIAAISVVILSVIMLNVMAPMDCTVSLPWYDLFSSNG
jgi:hypothetical protein